ncbi:MAG: hypothetical protein K9N21_03280 [Deltaproteobacteria bacterium]|nr:hypothetical protein [Deltaproteobacteria bacterium]
MNKDTDSSASGMIYGEWSERYSISKRRICIQAAGRREHPIKMKEFDIAALKSAYDQK